ncbi:MAG TPA: ribosomal-processing cysteine protease Prp [Bacillota bacterium]|jgi:uncharacterized protein YsxB (DUF464 family)|nr:ribosomal-processing cysteine protease Prp [Bacillota bacterium]HOB87843.1 ribosomal-processing cysteine protease Prp [Bacillota bacterium]HOP69929.1 ribosomal-processing cysteine protease Prp [Bacillota bacterium]HPT34084.1 ribosomal-processing cysteine protease Prp [Bacillota bacterium]HPZ64747.1 ribosomal-processing cysteine protease Prp [Bacillota bacterium]
MIRVTVWRKAAGPISGFQVEGHAGYAPAGEDIVCAAVSALTQAALLGLERLLGIRPAQFHCRRGNLKCLFQPAPEREGQLILETMVQGLKETAESYGTYLSLKEITEAELAEDSEEV